MTPSRLEEIERNASNGIPLSPADTHDLLDLIKQQGEALEEYEKRSPTLSAIRKILPLKTSWTVEEIKTRMLGKTGTPKDIYNSLGYLTRTGELRHTGYGSYETSAAPDKL